MTLENSNVQEKVLVKRMTKQRKAILNVLKNVDTHPTAETIYEMVRTELPDISLGTVYRNLQVLMEEKEINELSFGKRVSRFDGNTKPHYHFICECCGTIHDIEMFHAEIPEIAADYVDGTITSQRLEFYGICKHC